MALDKVKVESDRRFGLGRRTTEFRIPLTGVDIAQIESCAFMKNRQVATIAGRNIPNVQILSPDFGNIAKSGRASACLFAAEHIFFKS